MLNRSAEALLAVALPVRRGQRLLVDAGIVAYWQGGGGGIQHELPGFVADLLDSGILKGMDP